MNRKKLRIATLGTPADYASSLVPAILRIVGYDVEYVSPSQADLMIYGSFFRQPKQKWRWMPRPWRAPVSTWVRDFGLRRRGRSSPPLTLFHTAENLRRDFVKADFSISFDVDVSDERHCRCPYWMEGLDWSSEGITGNSNPRYGLLMKGERFLEPLGADFLARPRKAVLFSSHLREPRKHLLNRLRDCVPVDGYGPAFDKSIVDHHHNSFVKYEVLRDYAFNLCPENGIYPGYQTEKIPEAFYAGTLPITWSDPHVRLDFNSEAFVNLHDWVGRDLGELKESLLSDAHLKKFADVPLMDRLPEIGPVVDFLEKIAVHATS